MWSFSIDLRPAAGARQDYQLDADPNVIRIHSTPSDVARLPIGTPLVIGLEAAETAIEGRCFLRQSGMMVLSPLRDWQALPIEELWVPIEAPGRYTLSAQWRSSDGRHGWEELAFVVGEGRPSEERPVQLQLDDDVKVWMPSRWDASHRQLAERDVWEALPALVPPGSVVYDIGANVGAFSVRFGQLAGPDGRVYCIEPNPICVHFLRINLAKFGLQQAVILPTALLDAPGETRFAVNYGNTNVGISAESYHYGIKPGHEIAVACTSLDRLIEDYDLRLPQLVKIDVEGVEAQVVRGMTKTLERCQPAMILELHGQGCAQQTLEQLDGFGYQYRDPADQATFADAAAVCNHFGNCVFQIIAEARG